MTTRNRSSSSSSSSDTEARRTTRVRDISGTSEDIPQTTSHYSVAESATLRSNSPTASQRSAIATGTPYDTVSLATTTNTGFTNATGATLNTSASQQQFSDGVPVIRPPVLEQQHTGLPEINPHHGSNTSTSGAYYHQQQQNFDVVKAMFNQADTNQDGGISREEFRQWAQPGTQVSGQYQYQQAQFANQLPGEQISNQLLGADAFNDVVLNIDYGAIEAYNVGMQSAGDLTDGQAPANFDVVKAMFNQADINHDGGISRDEFRQWAQGGQQNVGGQSYSTYQTATTATNYGNHFNQAQLYPNANPDIANILQQSGLGQAYTNYG